MRSLLRKISPKAYDDGLAKCNVLGKELIRKDNVLKLLDVGCGDGKLTMEFASAAGIKDIYGVEFIDEFRSKAEEKGIHCYKYDLNSKWDFQDNYFDVILSSQCIEHMYKTRIYLEECLRCLKPGGQLIVLTENLSSWVNIGALFFGWQPFSITNLDGWHLGNPFIWHADESKEVAFMPKYEGTDVSVGHVRVFAHRGLKDMLSQVGFKDVNVFSRGYLPFWGAFSNLMCKIDKRHGHFLIASAVKR